MPRSGKAHKVRFGPQVLLVLISTVISLMFAEIGCRMLFPPLLEEVSTKSTINPYAENPYIINSRPYHHIHIPNSHYVQEHPSYTVDYHINSHGFRGPEYSDRLASKKNRLMIIGDSNVEGHGVQFNESFAGLLNTRFAPNNWDVVNAGVQGGGPCYFALNLDRYLYLNPDCVLIVIFDNDIMDDRFQESTYFSYPYLENVGDFFPGTVAFSQYSRLYSIIKKIYNERTCTYVESVIRDNVKELRRYGESLQGEAHVELQKTFASRQFYQKQWLITQRYLDYLVKQFQFNNVDVLIFRFALFHLKGEGYPGLHQLTGVKESEDAIKLQRLQSQWLSTFVEQWTNERNLPCFSADQLVGDYVKEKGVENLLIYGDGHPSVAGHQFLADSLAPWLTIHLLADK